MEELFPLLQIRNSAGPECYAEAKCFKDYFFSGARGKSMKGKRLGNQRNNLKWKLVEEGRTFQLGLEKIKTAA